MPTTNARKELNDVRDAAAAAADADCWETAIELVERYRVDLLCRFWCRAEATSWDEMNAAERDAVRERVKEAQLTRPGDLAVHAAQLAEHLRVVDEIPVELLREAFGSMAVERLHVYDSAYVKPQHKKGALWPLLGTANLGYTQYSNINVPQQIGTPGQPSLLTGWFVTTVPPIDGFSIPGELRLRIHHQELCRPVHALLNRHDRLLLPVYRHSAVKCVLEFFEDTSALINTRIFVHLLGWTTRPT